MILRALLKTFVLPPALQLAGIFVAWLLWRRWPGLARLILACSVISLTLLSMPIVSEALMATLKDQYSVFDPVQSQSAQVIVILGGGRASNRLEYGGDTVNARTLSRLRYGARLQRELKLPVLVTGGSVLDKTSVPEAQMMAAVLEHEFGVPVRWQEGLSQTTAENATYTAALLREQGLKNIILVTHSWHMQRAEGVFLRAGLTVIPAPMALTESEGVKLLDFVASPKALLGSYFALHEWLGYWVYRFQGLL